MTHKGSLLVVAILAVFAIAVGSGIAAGEQAKTTEINEFEPNLEGEDSQEAQIDITVVDTNGNAIEGALVELEDRGGSPDYRLATTGSDGQIRFVESTGPPPENCQTAKLHMADGTTRSADLGCRSGGESTSHTFQADRTNVETDLNKVNPNLEGEDSQEAQIDITVVDTNGNAIEGALVELEDRGGSPDYRLATTGSDGRIRFVESTGPPPENCQTAKLRMADGTTRSADLGCRNGGESTSHTFQVESNQEAPVFTHPLLPQFSAPPTNTEELDPMLYEDLDGDGEVTDIGPAVQVYGQLIRGFDLGLTDEEARKLNWAEGSPETQVSISDINVLYGEKARLSLGQGTGTATVTTEDANITSVGGTGTSTVSVDTPNGLSTADITVSVDTSVAKITDVAQTRDVGVFEVVDQTDESVTLEYSNIQTDSKSVNVTEIELERTGSGETPITVEAENVSYGRDPVLYGGIDEDEGTVREPQSDPPTDSPTDPAPESATVTAGTVNLQDPGDTAETAVSIDASGGISGVDVTVSVDSPNVEIADASPADERAGIQDLTGDSVNITFTEVFGSRQQIELADVRFEATGEVQNRVDITLDVPFARVAETTDVDVTTESGTIIAGDSPFGQPLIPGFTSPPENTDELDATLYEDLDGDGDGTEVTPAVKVFGRLIRGNDLGLTSTQAAKLDWDEDNGDSVDIDDMVALFGEKIRAG